MSNLLAPDERWKFELSDTLKALRRLPDQSCGLVFTSPPYSKARTYGRPGVARDSVQWAKWMRPIVVECCRIAPLAFFNVSDVVESFRYGGGPEMLVADLLRKDGLVMVRPYIWYKIGQGDDAEPNGVPGSGGDHFHRNDYEPIYGFARPELLGPRTPPKYTNNLAYGHPPKFSPGGQPRMRARSGRRQKLKPYTPPEIVNPGNVLRVRVGGQGSKTRHGSKGHAPMAIEVADRFIEWFAAPGSIVLDPFCGTGTTLESAVKLGRFGYGIDEDPEQQRLTEERMHKMQNILF